MPRVVVSLMLVTLFLWRPALAVDASTAPYFSMKATASDAIRRDEKLLTNQALYDRMGVQLAGLEAIVRSMLGPIQIDGLPSVGSIHPVTLLDELGGSQLDSLYFRSADGSIQALASNEALLREWLRVQQDPSTDRLSELSTDFSKAFVEEGFYTRAFDDDAHYYRYAEIPVVLTRGNGVARAILYARSWDWPAPDGPNGIAVAVETNGRVFVITQKLAVDRNLGVVPACRDRYGEDTKQGQRALEAIRTSPDRSSHAPEPDFDSVVDQRFRDCYRDHIAEQDIYPSIVRMAQALVDRIRD